MEGGSCNDYDYACGDPVNGLDLNGLKKKQALPDRDEECLGGGFAQINSPVCRLYQAAKASGNSDYYFYGEDRSDHGDILSRHASGIFEGTQYVFGVAAIVAGPFTGGVSTVIGLSVLSGAAGVASAAVDRSPCRDKRIATSIAFSAVGVAGGQVVARGAQVVEGAALAGSGVSTHNYRC